ncbi:MAG: tetratricopeptide repeat protein [Thermodesulfobacteriota bacterium]|nr:tetratricopeptide repeat protein [Thermodesulfobacteriota bacterium]
MKAVIKLIILLVTTTIITPWNIGFANPCDSAWGWFQEGLALYDNSSREAYYYQKAIEVCPEFVEAYNSLGRVYLNQGEYDLSIQAFKQAWIQSLSSDLFSSRPGSSDLFIEPIISLGEIYRMQGKYNLAAAEFKRALEINPDSFAAQNHLQYIYKRLHNYDFVLSPRNKMLTNGIFARIPGTTLPQGGIAFAMHYRNWRQTSRLTIDMFDNDQIFLAEPSPSERTTRIQSSVMGIRYGLSNNFTIGLMALYFERDVELQFGYKGMQEVNANPVVRGIGDLQFMVKYHLWGHKRNHLSLYNLLTIPTGKEKIATSEDYIWTFGEFTKVTRKIPLGSGSYDFTPGIALTTFYDPVIFQSNIQYRITDHKRVGDELAANFGAIYPLNDSVNALLETGYRWHGDTERDQTMYVLLLRPDYLGPMWIPGGPEEIETSLTSKGGHSLFIAPGLQFMLARGLKLELSVKFPILKQAEGWREGIVFHAGLVMMRF